MKTIIHLPAVTLREHAAILAALDACHSQDRFRKHERWNGSLEPLGAGEIDSLAQALSCSRPTEVSSSLGLAALALSRTCLNALRHGFPAVDVQLTLSAIDQLQQELDRGEDSEGWAVSCEADPDLTAVNEGGR
jgi:hypothetical protein